MMMSLFSLCLLLCLLATANAAGQIKIQNQPSGVMWCGQNFVLNFTYNGNVAAGTEFKVQLMFDAFDVQIGGNAGIGSNKEIALLGKVTAPATQFAIDLPSPFPTAWLGDKKLDNEGLQQQGLFRVSKVDDDDFNSDCSSTFCRDPSFAMICCPADNAAKCGCENRAAVPTTTSVATISAATTPSRAASARSRCRASARSAPSASAPPTTSASAPWAPPVSPPRRCATTIAAPLHAAGVPSRLNCPCSPDMLCESGTVCQLYFCRVSNAIPIGSLNCEPSLGVKAKDVCMLHKDGSAPRPYSCQNKKCTICEPGNRLCVCKSLACLNPGGHLRAGSLLPAHRLRRLPVHRARVLVLGAWHHLHLQHLPSRRHQSADNHDHLARQQDAGANLWRRVARRVVWHTDRFSVVDIDHLNI
jgi:hypothetical protein